MAEGRTSVTLDKFSELEELAEDILCDKQQVIELDKRKNTNRQALRALNKRDPTKRQQATKSWVCIGNTFLKFPNSSVQAMLQEDQTNIEEEITRLRKELKPKVSKLHEIEGLPEVKGFDLTALTQSDLQSLR